MHSVWLLALIKRWSIFPVISGYLCKCTQMSYLCFIEQSFCPKQVLVLSLQRTPSQQVHWRGGKYAAANLAVAVGVRLDYFTPRDKQSRSWLWPLASLSVETPQYFVSFFRQSPLGRGLWMMLAGVNAWSYTQLVNVKQEQLRRTILAEGSCWPLERSLNSWIRRGWESSKVPGRVCTAPSDSPRLPAFTAVASVVVSDLHRLLICGNLQHIPALKCCLHQWHHPCREEC